jgi:hypothetical protein
MKQAVVLLLAVSMLCLPSMALASEKKNEDHHIQGQVTSVDATAKTMVVKETLSNHQTKDVTFRVSDKTKITIKGKTGKFEDIKAGDAIHVRYIDKDHVHHVQELAIVPPPAKKS